LVFSLKKKVFSVVEKVFFSPFRQTVSLRSSLLFQNWMSQQLDSIQPTILPTLKSNSEKSNWLCRCGCKMASTRSKLIIQMAASCWCNIWRRRNKICVKSSGGQKGGVKNIKVGIHRGFDLPWCWYLTQVLEKLLTKT